MRGNTKANAAQPACFFPPLFHLRVMSQQAVGSTSWGRSDHISTTGSGSSRMGARGRPSVFRSDRSDRSFDDNRFYDPTSTTSSRSGYKRRRRSSSITERAATDDQTSLTLNSTLAAFSFERSETGIGLTASLTSSNNFINFCDTVSSLPITDGKQIQEKSCNPAPMGLIPSTDHLPSVRILQPPNLTTLKTNTAIGLELSVSNLHTGVSVNPATNYLAAPQQLDSTGDVLGHYHVVVEELDALNSTIPADIQKFVFFSIIKDPDVNGAIQSSIPNGLPDGFYRVTVTAHAANHQPVLVPLSQHGSLNDAVYFTVTATGAAGSTPSVKRRAPIPLKDFQRAPFKATGRVIPRADTDADAQSSLTLLPSVIAQGFSNDGQNPPTAGQSGSLTSTNNFINFCGLTTLPVTDGTQVLTGFCVPAPMGVLPASTQMPSSKFTYPRNGEILAPNAPMTVGLAVTNFAMGNFADPQASFLSAPQQLDASGNIQGHPIIIFEPLSTSIPIVPTDPRRFALVKGISGKPDSTGVVTTTITGLPAGVYRVSSLIVAANSQPVLMPVLQHGAVDDTIFITVVDGGALPTNQTALPAGFSAPSTSTTTTTPSSPSHSATTSLSSTPSLTATSTPAKTSHVAVAVGGALAGIAVIALLLLALWFVLRRRRIARAMMLESHPVVLTGSDFGDDPPMAQVAATPAALCAQKHGRALPLNTRRGSIASAAPSYHTQANFK
ncbi:hypothetical protein FB451DRAFT_671382 [Mycena latifolia]|nr:hypothetical protein FB451DRAFT_671382 [Mycena latifolia]